MFRLILLAMIFATACGEICWGQQLEPRRWSHLPIGSNFGGTGYAYSGADIAFDPVLKLDDVTMELHTLPIKYIRCFELAGKTARIDWIQTYQKATWKGLLDGSPASTSRSGWSDMALRLAVNVIGAPPLRGEEYAAYRAETSRETIVGLALLMQFPTGHYKKDKLLNIGTNRFTFRPQFGAVQRWEKWSTELTGSAWIHTDNEEFFNGNVLEQDPLFTLQGHLDYTFRPGLWAGTGLGYGTGNRSTINSVDKDDRRENLAWVASVGYPFSPRCGIKFSYIGIASLVNVGADIHTGLVAVSALW
ncbi:MAG: transporter [Rubripirellula sp.]